MVREVEENVGLPLWSKVLGVLFVLVVLFFLFSGMFVERIDNTHVGVIYNAMGGLDENTIWTSGWHLKIPFLQSVTHVPISRETINMYGMNWAECQKDPECSDIAVQVPSKEGLIITVDATVFFRVNPAKAPQVVKQLTMNYRSGTVEPLMRSVVRDVTGRMTITELYGAGRGQMETQMFAMLKEDMDKDNLILEGVMIRDIEMPEQIKQAIEDKMKSEQTSLQKDYEIQIAQKEANRTVTEAKGKADALAQQTLIDAQAQATKTQLIANAEANATVVKGLAQAQAIEAINRQLAQSPNYVQLVIAQQWNGQLPQFTGSGAIPLLNIPMNATK